MNLLNRYLQAVGKYLPKARREDILAELRANMLAQMEDREEARGRPLTEAEVIAILQDHGNPAFVAGRYFPENRGLSFGRQLIGPELFPFYRFILAMNLGITLAVGVVISRFKLFTGSQMLVPLLAQFAAVTLIFALLELGKDHVLNKWDPGKLPALKNPEDGPNAESIFGFIALAVGTLWLALTPQWPFLLLGPGAVVVQSMQMKLMPEWHEFYGAILLLLCAQLVVQFFTVFRLLARRKARIAELVLKVVGVGIGAALLRKAPNFVTSPQPQAADWANQIFLISLIVAFAINAFDAGRLFMSLLRERHQMLPARQH